MIETQRKHAPWRWVFLISAPWFFTMYVQFLSGAALTYTLKKFIDNPGWISTIASLDTWFNILVGMGALYMSDRVWTRLGRRKPFLIAAWVPLAILFLIIPFAPNYLTLLTIVVIWQAIFDIGSTFEPLQQEVVPPHQRGRSGSIFQIAVQLCVMFYFTFMIGRFDDVEYIGNIHVSGDQIVFWLGSLFLVGLSVFVLLFVKERKVTAVDEKIRAFKEDFAGIEKYNIFLRPFIFIFKYLTNFVKSVFGEKDLWPIYLLTFSMSLMTFGLGAIQPLIYTEQWGYSKQEMGTNVFIGGVINLVLLAIIGIFADKLNRIKMFIFGSAGTLILNAGYYIIVQFFLPGRRPELWQIIVMGEIVAIFSLISGAVGQPLAFDYIPRSKMGTASAGRSFIRSMTKLLAVNGIGWFVVYYSKIFMPPGEYDYFSAYLFLIFGSAIGLILVLNFNRLVKKGLIKKAGVESIENSSVTTVTNNT